MLCLTWSGKGHVDCFEWWCSCCSVPWHFCISHRPDICWIKHHQTPGTVMHTMLFLFVCLGFIVPHENFSLIWRRHHCRWRAAIFYLYLLWHGASVFNGHLPGSMTVTPIAERLEVELSLPVLRLINRSVAAGIRTPNLPGRSRHHTMFWQSLQACEDSTCVYCIY